MFNAVCPFCFQRYTLDDSYIGKMASCRQCKRMFELSDDDTATNFGPLIISEDNDGKDSESIVRQSSRQVIAVNSAVAKQQVASPKLSRRFDPTSGMWNIGDVILGVYEVIPISDNEPFSEGGAGVVNRIYHREWDMELAVKSPKPQVFQSESGKLNYENEAQTWIELGLHQNIVTCYLVRRISDIPRLFAEFVKDGSLKQWIADGRLYLGGVEAALLRILDIAIQAAWGIEHAHSQKLLHLDVKPANIMMSGQVAKVTDFGLAQGVSDITMSSANDSNAGSGSGSGSGVRRQYPMAAGGMTPGFCSPEQFISFERAKKNDFDNLPKITLQSDIWSWGISLLAMFHGRTPCKRGGQTARKVLELFLRDTEQQNYSKNNEAEQNIAVTNAVTNIGANAVTNIGANAGAKSAADTNSFSASRPLMPKRVSELLFYCFEENPDKRPRSMGEVAERLAEIYRELSGAVFSRVKPISTTWTPETINNRAASMLDLGKPAEAKQLLDQAELLQPWHSEVTYNQTMLSWRAAQVTDLQAVERLESLIKMRSDDANAIYALALAQRERGNLKTAIEETARAIEIEPREEYRRAFVAIEKIITRTARCVERVQVAQGFEGRICVDGRGEFILVERLVTDLGDGIDGEGKIFEVIKTATGQVLHKFTQQIVEGETQKVSLSEDLLWELIDETNNEGERVSALLRRVGAKTSEARFRLIAWSNNLSATLSASEIIAGKIYSGRVNGNKVDIIDNANGNEIGGLIGHEGAVTALSFSENGKFVLTGGADRTLRLWELPVLRCLRTFTAIGGAALAVYLDVNGKFALSLESGGLVRIWDVSILCSGNLFRAPLLLSHVTSSEEAGRRQSEMNNYYVNIKESIRKSDYAAAISFISAASLLSGWETMRMRLGVEGVWNSIAKHARRKSLSATICSSILKGHHDVISTVAISANGKLAASAGKDTGIRVWNIAGQKCVCELAGHSDWVRSIGLTRDGRFLFSGSWDGTVRVWNIATGKCVRTTEERIKSITKIAVNPQSRTVAIATAQGRVILWDVLTNKVKGVLAAGTSAVNAIKYSGNGEYLVTGSEDGNVLLWRLGSDIPERVLGVHKTAVTDVEIAADLSRVISADRDGKVLICNFSGGVQEGEVRGHLSEITGLVFLPDSRFFMSCSKDAKVRINSVDGNNSLSNEVEHLSPVLAISIDQYGNHFVTGSDDAVLRVWSLYWNYELTE